MTYSQTAIHLGDLARALEALEPSDEQTQLAIAMKLGMHWDTPQPQKASPERKLPERFQPPLRPAGQRTTARAEASNRPLPSRLEHTRNEDAAPSIYVPPLESSAPEDEPHSPPLDPLFFPRWTRGILSAALATAGDVGQVDVERVVKLLASGTSLQELPLLSAPTLSRGVQLLIDRSQAMLPFMGDQARLHEEILRVVGRGRVTTLRFVGCPSRGAGVGAEMSWSEYEPPVYGTPVLLLTDLGIGRPRLSDERAGVAEWLKFARLLEKANCPLLAFVPYPASRWPQSLTRHMKIIQWDRKTTATTVRSKVRCAHEVGP
jgi:hypothetical protein